MHVKWIPDLLRVSQSIRTTPTIYNWKRLGYTNGYFGTYLYIFYCYFCILTLFIYHSTTPWINILKLKHRGLYNHGVSLDASAEDMVPLETKCERWT